MGDGEHLSAAIFLIAGEAINPENVLENGNMHMVTVYFRSHGINVTVKYDKAYALLDFSEHC